MSSIDDIVDISITATTTTPTRKGFGTQLLLVYHTHYVDLVREYANLQGMTDDGFTLTEPAYRMAQKAFSQNPRPKSVKIGRTTTAVAHKATLTVQTATQGEKISCTVVSPAGVETAISRTVPGSSSTTAEATAVAALIDAIAGLGAVGALAVITATGDTTGQVWYYKDLHNLAFAETTVDADIDDALTAIEAVDDDWYWFSIYTNSVTNVEKAAAWVETRKKMYLAQTADDVELSASVLGVALKGFSYDRSPLMFSRDTIDYLSSGLGGRLAPLQPGSYNGAFKTIKGVTGDKLTTSQISALKAQHTSWYETIAGLTITREMKAPSGQYVDLQVGIDWLQARIQERVFALLARLDKVSYTDPGVALIVAEIQACLDEGVRVGLLNPGDGDTIDPPGVVAPKVADVDPADRANRLLPDIEFAGQLAGAVNNPQIRGTLSI